MTLRRRQAKIKIKIKMNLQCRVVATGFRKMQSYFRRNGHNRKTVVVPLNAANKEKKFF
jgi:hypothetical protein